MAPDGTLTLMPMPSGPRVDPNDVWRGEHLCAWRWRRGLNAGGVEGALAVVPNMHSCSLPPRHAGDHVCACSSGAVKVGEPPSPP